MYSILSFWWLCFGQALIVLMNMASYEMYLLMRSRIHLVVKAFSQSEAVSWHLQAFGAADTERGCNALLS